MAEKANLTEIEVALLALSEAERNLDKLSQVQAPMMGQTAKEIIASIPDRVFSALAAAKDEQEVVKILGQGLTTAMHRIAMKILGTE